MIKFKKIFYGLGITTISLVSFSTVISCTTTENKGRPINSSQTKVSAWLSQNVGWYLLVQDNDQKGGGSIDMPMFDMDKAPQLGDIYSKTGEKSISKIDLKTTTPMSIKHLKSLFFKANKEIMKIKSQNQGVQYIAFYHLNNNDNITIKLKPLKQKPNGDTTFSFLNNIKAKSDFLQKPIASPYINNGLMLSSMWPIKLTKDAWRAKGTPGDKHNYNSLRDDWALLTGNRVSSKTQLEQDWLKNPINLIGYPYIDYNAHTLKLISIAFEGGQAYNTLTDTYDMAFFEKAKYVKYKITTIENFVPLKKITATPQDAHADIEKLLGLITQWMAITMDGPKIVENSLAVATRVLPQIQGMMENIQLFTEEWKVQQIQWGIDNNEDDPFSSVNIQKTHNKLNLFNPSSESIEKMIKSLEDNHYDFGHLKDLLAILGGIKYGTQNPTKWKMLGNISVDEKYLNAIDLTSYDVKWILSMNKQNEFLLFSILYFTKYVATAWSENK